MIKKGRCIECFNRQLFWGEQRINDCKLVIDLIVRIRVNDNPDFTVWRLQSFKTC